MYWQQRPLFGMQIFKGYYFTTHCLDILHKHEIIFIPVAYFGYHHTAIINIQYNIISFLCILLCEISLLYFTWYRLLLTPQLFKNILDGCGMYQKHTFTGLILLLARYIINQFSSLVSKPFEAIFKQVNLNQLCSCYYCMRWLNTTLVVE